MVVSREALALLYGDRETAILAQAARYDALRARFFSVFPERKSVRFFSAPGRAEIGGNHTDHQLGRVLAAAVDLDTVAAAAPNGTMRVRIHSEGFAPIEVDLTDLTVNPAEFGTTVSIIRGVAARLNALDRPIGGFDAVAASDVLVGSGLSSSAAFEVLACTVFDRLFGAGDLPPVLAAQISQYAENEYFGKPSGLMDQTASAVGGLVAIDFGGAEPDIQPLQFDFAAHGYSLAVVNTGGSHDDLTGAYAAIRTEMEQVAACFGADKLRRVDPPMFEVALPALLGKVPDRAILRAIHFFDENDRVPAQVAALLSDDLPRFLSLIVASGESSWKLLQNLCAGPESQPLAVALEMSRRMLDGCGAWRVHGGGFAGTILAFVPLGLMDGYRARMDAAFGEGACRALNIRPVGAYEIPLEE